MCIADTFFEHSDSHKIIIEIHILLTRLYLYACSDDQNLINQDVNLIFEKVIEVSINKHVLARIPL